MLKLTFREIKKSKKRFFSLMLLVMLAVAFLAGLKTTSPDMKYTAIKYFKDYNLMDIKFISESGYDDECLTKIKKYEGIKDTEGEKEQILLLDDMVIAVKSMPQNINKPRLVSGRLPETEGECVIDEAILEEMDIKLGDYIELSDSNEDDITSKDNEQIEKGASTGADNEILESDAFSYIDNETTKISDDNAAYSEEYAKMQRLAEIYQTGIKTNNLKVVGIVNSPLYIATGRGTSTTGNGEISAFIYIDEDEFNAGFYTYIYATLYDTQGMDAYSDEYDDLVEEYIDNIDEEIASGIMDGKSYILDRSSNIGYLNYSLDSDKMADLAKVFPVIFYLVAALSCLTTMTRMVEDDRSEIGTLKALGYSNSAIIFKYIFYGLLSSIIGALIGIAWGCTIVPYLAFTAWKGQYTLPDLVIYPQMKIYIISIAIAVVLILFTTIHTCKKDMRKTPATLLRPRSPKPGKRILLERITFLWNRFKFSTKVSCRNLFRYKQRFFMTVIGIAGCCALLVVGFGLYDAIYAILDKQYAEITLYDAVISLDDDITDEELKDIREFIDENDNITDYKDAYTDIVTAKNTENDEEKKVQGNYLLAIKDTSEIEKFITLRDRKSGEKISFPSDMACGDICSAIFTEKLADTLGVTDGDIVKVTLSNEDEIILKVYDITENYVNNYIYLNYYDLEKIYDGDININEIILEYAEGFDEDDVNTGEKSISSDIVALSGTSSYTYIRDQAKQFEKSINAVNAAVTIIIVAAASLAFVVLYNLTNINVTERMRELATLKVLGFTDRETTEYLYRENIVMTIIGIIAGLFGGKYLVVWLITTVENEYMMFGRDVSIRSYIISAMLTAAFSLFVNLIAHFTIKKIDMVESLKCVE